MKWPWVSRAAYEAAIRSHRDSLSEHVSTLDRIQQKSDAFQAAHDQVVAVADKRYSDLQEVVATLREQKSAASVTIQRLTDDLAAAREALAARPAQPRRSKLTQAIRDNARMPDGTIDRRLVGHFRSEANKLLRQNVKEEDVIASLSNWQTTERADQMTADRMADAFDAEAV